MLYRRRMPKHSGGVAVAGSTPEEEVRQYADALALTPRQRQIAHLVARGLVNKEIAAELGVRESTVALHLRFLYARLGVSRRAALIHALWSAGMAPR
jgi:DNA-binding NarL/FixJ family response regulator